MRVAALLITLTLPAGCDKEPQDKYLMIIHNEGTASVYVDWGSGVFDSHSTHVQAGETWDRQFSETDLSRQIRVTVVRKRDWHELYSENLDEDDFTGPGKTLIVTVYP